MTNISKNLNVTKGKIISVNTTTNSIVDKFETDHIIDDIVVNPSTNQAYVLGYDGDNATLFIVKPP